MRDKKPRCCEHWVGTQKEWEVNTWAQVPVSCLSVLLWGWEQCELLGSRERREGCLGSRSPRGNSMDLGRAPAPSPFLATIPLSQETSVDLSMGQVISELP